MTSHSAKYWQRAGTLLAAVGGAIVLTIPSLAAAHLPPSCPESWNPPAVIIPPAGYKTEPGTNPNSGQNPDGFFELNSSDGHDLRCFDGCPAGFGGAEPAEDGGTGFEFGTFADGTHVKYTEANGKDPAVQKMAGNNGGGNGRAVEVDWHFWGQGDLWICDAVDPSICTCCRVSPPPR
ncbi:hypothetical protein [Anaeromyxobacter terrae]|uniref:hypothetical protein n=1 Tax=Anaeromyxobacter terrae TaxID=2925406 RepID=UPI001F57E133|nr:hypothetical protein [Anaeromyxobacter sp. SG22]